MVMASEASVKPTGANIGDCSGSGPPAELSVGRDQHDLPGRGLGG